MKQRPDQRRNILYIRSSGGLAGGTELCLKQTVLEVASSGWETLVVVPFEGDLSAAPRARGAEVVVMELGAFRTRREIRSFKLILRLIEVVPAVIRLARLIHTRTTSIVHSNTSVLLAGAIAARLVGVPHVWYGRAVLSRHQYLVNWARAFTVGATFLRRRYEAGRSGYPIRKWPNPILRRPRANDLTWLC